MTNQTNTDVFAKLTLPALKDAVMQAIVPSLREALKEEYKVEVPVEFFQKLWGMAATPAVKAVRTSAAAANGKATCTYEISRGVRKGQECGRTATEDSDPPRCKACLTKGGGKKVGDKAKPAAKTKGINALLNGKIRSSITGNKAESKDIKETHKDDLIHIDGDNYHHKPSGLVVEIKDNKMIAVGKMEDDEVVELSDEDKSLAVKHGIIMKNTDDDESEKETDKVEKPQRKTFTLNNKKA